MKILIYLLVFIFVTIIITRRMDIRSEKDSEQNDMRTNTEIELDKKRNNDSLITKIHFNVVGTRYKRVGNKTGQQIIKEIVNKMRREGYFDYGKYEDMTDKEIMENTFGERIYEFHLESIPFCVMEKEDDNEYDKNAIKVMVGYNEHDLYHIGYVPREHCEQMRILMKQHRMVIDNRIIGGKYKYVDLDDYGEEKIYTDSTPYGLELYVSFWETNKKEN